MPVLYSGIVAEHLAVRTVAGLFDVSHMGRLEITGAQALTEVNRLITNDLQGIPDGRAVYACCCRENGGILDDVIVYRHSPERILVICNAANHSKIAGHFAQELAKSVHLDDLSASTGLLALQGPKAEPILRRLGFEKSAKLTRFSFCWERLAGTSLLVARTGYTGEDGFEIVAPATELVSLWHSLMQAGADDGIVPVGLGARDTLRLEACLSLYGHEIDETTQPLEAGLGFAVKLGKPEFIGRDALVRASQMPPTRKLVGIVMQGRGIARESYPLLNRDQQVVGKVTSGAPAPTVGVNVALGYVPLALAELDSTVFVDCRGKLVEARVVATPFYRRARQGSVMCKVN